MYGGRWSSPKTRLAYTSTSAALAMLEFLAHVAFEDFDLESAPRLVVITANLGDVPVLTLDDIGVALPRHWDDVPAPADNAVIGDDWVQSMSSVALSVPSVHTPRGTPEQVVLINPAHPDFAAITLEAKPFAYDARLMRSRERPERKAPREKMKKAEDVGPPPSSSPGSPTSGIALAPGWLKYRSSRLGSQSPRSAESLLAFQC